mmetsp:Transcript_44410/g.105203  ORF Transcript_44410/g.105203 Transcript_44410/m.105203 type:complete len:445 (-) Transcript_44410:70-1404(-)
MVQLRGFLLVTFICSTHAARLPLGVDNVISLEEADSQGDAEVRDVKQQDLVNDIVGSAMNMTAPVLDEAVLHGHAPPPDHSEVWTLNGYERQVFFWYPTSSAEPTSSGAKQLAVAVYHGIYGTILKGVHGLAIQELRAHGYPVCAFDQLDHGSTRLLQDEFAGKALEDIECMKNGGTFLNKAKGQDYVQRYIEPVRAFPAFCAERLESLLSIPDSNLRVVNFANSWGANLNMMALLGDDDAPERPNPRLAGLVTSNAGLDSNKFQQFGWKMLRKGLFALMPLLGDMSIGTGFTLDEGRVKDLDPAFLPNSNCPEVAQDELDIGMSFGKVSYKQTEKIYVAGSGMGKYVTHIPMLHEYCSADDTIVPELIEEAGHKAEASMPDDIPVCMFDLHKYGTCLHGSFPLRAGGWGPGNEPWKVLWSFLGSLEGGNSLHQCPEFSKRVHL